MDLVPLRNILYEILLSGGESDADIKATQQLAVNMSSAVKKDGVNIFQLQSVVNKQVIQKVTEALRFIDEHTHKAIEVQEAEVVDESANEIVDLIYDSLDKKLSLVDFTDHMAERYAAEAVKSMGRTEAKNVLKVREPKLIRILGTYGLDDEQ